MNFRTLMFLAATTAALWSAPLQADIRVRGYTNAGALVYSPADVASWANITLALGTTGATKVFVFDSNGSPGNANVPNESVGDIDISSSGTGAIYLIIGNPANLGANPVVPSGPTVAIDPSFPDRRYAVGLGAISGAAKNRVVLIAQIAGDAAISSTGGVKTIDVGKVRRLFADGAVVGTVAGRTDNLGGTTANDYAIGYISAATIDATASIKSGFATFSSIYRVDAGTISGTIDAEGSVWIVNASGDISMVFPDRITARALVDSVEANNITGGINCSEGAVRRVRARTGNLTGSVIGKTISGSGTDSGVNIAGTLTGQVSAVYTSNPAACDITLPITVGSMATGSGVASQGKIGANITSTVGKIGIVRAGDAIGSSGAPVTITAATGIDEFSTTSTAGVAYANVTCTTGGIGTFSIPYQMGGTVTADSITSFYAYYLANTTLIVRNAVPANAVYTVENDVASGLMRFNAGFGGRLMIGHSLASGGTIVFGNQNLFGQVVINSANSGGAWLGTVRTNGTTGPILTPVPAYAFDSGYLGGGAVGEAPYQLHKEDCVPETSGTYSSDPASVSVPQEYGVWQFTNPALAADYPKLYPPLPQLRTRFYGPVRRTGVSGSQDQGVAVQRFDGSNWVDATSIFSVSGPGNVDSLVRDLITAAKPCVNYQPGLHRIVRNNEPLTSTSRLKCAYVAGNPDVAQFAHYFKFNAQCNPADVGIAGGLLGYDGLLDNNDFIAFINLFTAGDTRADLGVAAGFNGQDQLFDNNDFIAHVNHFLSSEGCSNPVGSCLMSPGSGEGFAQAQFSRTGDLVVDRQLDALWFVYNSTGSQIVLDRITQTYFEAGTQ